MSERLEHWDEALASKLTDVQSKLSLAKQLPAPSTSRSSLLSDAHKLLVRCRFAKTTYKSELAQLDEDSRTRKLYEKKLLALEEVMVRAEEDLAALESAAVVDVLPDDNETYAASTVAMDGGGGCAGLPNAAIGAESKTYDKMHKLFDPLLDFTTNQCGCNPISFAVGTGGRYEYQNSVVDEYEDTNAYDLMSAATSYVPSMFSKEEPSVVPGSKAVASKKLNGNSAVVGKGGQTAEKKNGCDGGSNSSRAGAGSPIASSLHKIKSKLEERGEKLEQLHDQTGELESGAQTFSDMAKQLKESVKAKANGDREADI